MRNFLLILLLPVFLLASCSAADAVPFLEKITAAVGGWGGFTAIIAGMIEIVVRLVPSVNPRSILLLVASVGHAASRMVEALAGFLDKVIPQNVKPA